jgi:predicted N-acyltransferase
MRLRFLDRISQLPAERWDFLFSSDYPFTQHAFLDALEQHECASPHEGWVAHHAVLEDTAGTAVAAAPLYFKLHSYGEFVFDFSWAEASRRLGRRYYPKALIAVPFTPSAGPRIGAVDDAARTALLDQLWAALQSEGLSSLHALFLQEADAAAAAQAGGIPRHDIQFHWCNHGDRDFGGFVARLASEKRKKILRERRRVREAGIRFEWRDGESLNEAEWAEIHALYGNTYEERGQAPYLTLDFFLDYGRRPGSPFRLILAYEGARMVAVAITVLGGNTLYGRHWGAAERYHSLHFETCYYQGLDFCLQHSLKRFDAGTQGEHKLARGFDPVITQSAHWLADARLGNAVQEALVRERAAVAAACIELKAHSAYRQLDDVARADSIAAVIDR